MAGMFDDLIPAGQQQAQGAGMFDDLIPVEQDKPQVGAGEAFFDDLGAGSARIGRDVLAAMGSPALAVDAIANKLTGHETGASEWWAKNVFGPYNETVDAYAKKRAETERGMGAEVAGAGGALINMVPEMVAGNKVSQAMKVAEGVPVLGQLLTRAFASAQPMAAHAGVDRYADAKAMGADTLTAANAGLGTYGNMAVQGVAPMGASGGIVKRAVTGAAANPVLGAGGRALENIINATSGDPRLQQQVVDPKQMIVDAVIGGGMHTTMGEGPQARMQTPDAVAADRAVYDAAARQLAGEAKSIAGVEAPTIQADGTVIGDMSRAQMQDSGNRAAATRQLYAETPAVDPTVERSPNMPPAPSNEPDAVLASILRSYDNVDGNLPPTVREGMQKENRDAAAKQAFDLAARRQRQADADMANRGEIGPDYQGGGSAAHGGQFDSGVRRVTLLDSELPVDVVSVDGNKATVSIDQNGKQFEFEVDAKRLTEHDIPQNQRMAQDFMARSSEPPQGVGTETMAGEKMPRRSTDRIAGDEIGGRTTPYDPTPKDGGAVEGSVLPPDTGSGMVPRGNSEGQTVNGESARPTAGFEPPNGQRQIGERRLLEDRNRFTVDEQGRAVDRENRQAIPAEGKPLTDAPEPRQSAQEAPPRQEQRPADTTTAKQPEQEPEAPQKAAGEPLTVLGSEMRRSPEGVNHEVTMSDGSIAYIYKSDAAGDHGLGAWHLDHFDTHKLPDDVTNPSSARHISDVLGYTKAEALAALPERLKQIEQYKRAETQQTPTQRVKADPELLPELKRMSENAGWQEVGGKLLRDNNDQAVGRTEWIPREPWFAAGMGEKNVHEAVGRIEEGKPLTKKHREIVERMLEFIDDNDVLGRKAEAQENRASESVDETPQHEADYDLYERALLVDRDAFYRIIEEHANSSPEAVEAELRRMLDGKGNQNATEATGGENVQGGADGQGGGKGSRSTGGANEENARTGQRQDEAARFDVATLDGKRITIDGQRVDAGEHIRSLDSRMDAMKKLLDCIGG